MRASSPDDPPRKKPRKRRSGWRPSDAKIILTLERRLAAIRDSVSSPPTPEQPSEIRRLQQLIATIRECGTR